MLFKDKLSKLNKEELKNIIHKVESHPELFPIVLLVALGIAVVVISPGASAIAYKTATYEGAKIAFKYIIL